MRVFISWSGETSRKVADILYEWLRMIKIPTLEPYISDELDKGEVWFLELRKALKSADCGILCVTEENVAAPWLLFEAGALLTAKRRSFVTPLLFHVSPSRLSAPFTHLQSAAFNKRDIHGLVSKLNRFCGKSGLSEAEFERLFEDKFPILEQGILSVPFTDKASVGQRQQRKNELAEELLQMLMEHLSASDKDMEGRLDNNGETFKNRST